MPGPGVGWLHLLLPCGTSGTSSGGRPGRRRQARAASRCVASTAASSAWSASTGRDYHFERLFAGAGRGRRGRKRCRSRLHDRRKLLLEGSVIMIRMVGRPGTRTRAVRGLLSRRADPLTRVPCFKSKLLALWSRVQGAHLISGH